MTEKSKAALKVAKGVNDTQAQSAEKKETKVKTLEELQKENEELKQKLSAVPADLEKKIEYFNRKRQLIKKLDALIVKKESLLTSLDGIAEVSAKSEFTNDRFILTLKDAEKYHSERDIITMKNPVIIGEVLNFVIAKIETLQKDLQKQIDE